MKGKLLIVLLMSTLAVCLYGCGAKETAAATTTEVEEESTTTVEAASFSLISDTITLECGTPFDQDISKYVIADNIEDITMEVEPGEVGKEKFENMVRSSPREYSILFTDSVTQDSKRMKVIYDDTTPPVLSFPYGNEITICTLTLNNSGEGWELVPSTFIGIGSVLDSYLSAKDSRYTISDGIISLVNTLNFCAKNKQKDQEVFCEIDDYGKMSDKHFTSTNTGDINILEQYPEPGIYDEEIVVTDSKGNTSKAKISINVMEDVSQKERNYYYENYTFEDGFIDKLLEEYRIANK